MTANRESYMQLNIDNDAYVYDMNGGVVSMKRNLNQFSNPIDFSHSGFVQKSDKLRCETSFDFSLAVKRQS